MKEPLRFILDPKNTQDRLDVIFYHSPLVDEFKKEIKNLVRFDKFIKGLKRYPTFYNIPYLPEGISCLRVESINEDGHIDYKNIDYIPKIIHEKFPLTHLNENDMIMAVRGHTVGKVGLIPKDLVGSNISANLIRIEFEGIRPLFLKYFLMSKYGQAQIQQLRSGALQYTITTDDIRNILIPEIKETIQDEMVNKTKKYENLIKENWSLYNKILNKIKDILKIDIHISEKNVFEINKEEIIDRLDCYSLSENYKHIIISLKKIKDNFNLLRGNDLNIVHRMNKETYEMLKSKQVKYLEVKHSTKQPNLINSYLEDILIVLPTRARQIVKENDILLPRPILSTKKVVIVPKEYDGQICSTGFIVIRPKDYNEACLLTVILKSEIVQKQLFYLQSGSIQPEITPTDFGKIIIPIPKKEAKRESIIKEFKERIKEAESTRNKYYEAKKQFKETFLKELLKAS